MQNQRIFAQGRLFNRIDRQRQKIRISIKGLPFELESHSQL